MYEYSGHIMRVIDGDTMHVKLDLGFDTYTHVTLRLAGVDTPEVSTDEGLVAKAFVTKWLLDQRPSSANINDLIPVRIRTIKDKKEKWGRYLAVIWPHDSTTTMADVTVVGSLNANLIMQGWAFK